MKIIDQDELEARVHSLLINAHFPRETADICARVICQNSADGVHSHGLARLSRLIKQVGDGSIDIHARSEKVGGVGCMEQWDGKNGVGIPNALAASNRAMTLAGDHGMGIVGLKNNSHWLRPGYYGWHAADRGYAFMCWTNTMGNMPPWGGRSPLLGNNPMVMALPRNSGRHLVLDMAVSQFSFGALGEYSRRGEQLPVPGGWDENDNLSSDPDSILKSVRPLPAGFWKGSALSIMLDLFATALSAGASVAEINSGETNLSQVFLAFKLGNPMTERIEEAAELLQDRFNSDAGSARYPGASVYAKRQKSKTSGVEIPESLWKEIQNIA